MERITPMTVIESYESEVRRYCRDFPVAFERAKGEYMWDTSGKQYIDFFSSAGSLNYGHNHPRLKARAIAYLQDDGFLQTLDMVSPAKVDFIASFAANILEPRDMNYKFQFVGPAGTNSVEAALRLARKSSGREPIVTFEGSFHGVTQGSRGISAVTGDTDPSVYVAPFGGEHLPIKQAIGEFNDFTHSLPQKPAAVFLETVQGEGGVRPAHIEWLQYLNDYCRVNDIVLIVDDIQVGCGRTGTFFSFEKADIKPDIICLSKSLSGMGIPMSMLLIRPDRDVWKPGEHSGTFRGNALSFVCAHEAIKFWSEPEFLDRLQSNMETLAEMMARLKKDQASRVTDVRGRGMIWGIEFSDSAKAKKVREWCFNSGVIAEVVGAEDRLLKLLPSLNIPEASLKRGVAVISDAITHSTKRSHRYPRRYESRMDSRAESEDSLRATTAF